MDDVLFLFAGIIPLSIFTVVLLGVASINYYAHIYNIDEDLLYFFLDSLKSYFFICRYLIKDGGARLLLTPFIKETFYFQAERWMWLLISISVLLPVAITTIRDFDGWVLLLHLVWAVWYAINLRIAWNLGKKLRVK